MANINHIYIIDRQNNIVDPKPFVYGRGSARNELCNVDWTIVSNMGVIYATSNTKSEAWASPFKSNFFKLPYLEL